MDLFEKIARDLELSHNDVKWYESVKRTADALRKAYAAGVREGAPGGLVIPGRDAL